MRTTAVTIVIKRNCCMTVHLRNLRIRFVLQEAEKEERETTIGMKEVNAKTYEIGEVIAIVVCKPRITGYSIFIIYVDICRERKTIMQGRREKKSPFCFKCSL